MKRIVPAVAAILLIVSAASAAPKWAGAGWYRAVEVSQGGQVRYQFIVSGPYGNEKLCLENMHPDYTSPGYDEDDPDSFNDYSCLHLPSRPDWDD